MPERLRLSRAKGFHLPADAVNVARPGKWGNPFVVGRHGTAAECVRLYRLLIAEGLVVVDSAPSLRAQMTAIETFRRDWRELADKRLACWCRLDQPCHADVLMQCVETKIANAVAAHA